VSKQQLHAGLALLGGPAHGLPLDGEIMFPSGQAVSWKEWASASTASARVLVKDADSARLAALEELLATLRAK
jgi:phosphoribosyl-dephospho-CoA transferase